MATPPAPRGRWAYVTTDLRVLLTCARCGAVVQGSHRRQHEAWHDYVTDRDQPELFPTDDSPPPF